ncbi:MAG TPA: right-handed parallel beta-helix repeat-containing protein [Chitinophagaceae bacterium]|nr:right-handed parallel beta-helix repeat-containing protein [Chitinophagaceae bacterium]
MKQTLIHFSLSVFIVFSFFTSNAKTYYFSNNSGNDTRTSTQAQSQSTPWKTVAKLNSFMASIAAGDSILFKSGEVFYGSIIVAKSGSTSLPIIFSSYGSGSRPTITGFQTLTNWVSIGNGIYESYNSALGASLNMVTLNGNLQPMGRYPNITAANKGYLTFESHTANSITDQQLTSSTNWAGAELVVRPKRWILDRRTITAHSGSTLSYGTALTYNPYDNYGYFIQNSIKTLDQLGEWYYNSATKKVDAFFGGSSPSTFSFLASTVNTVVSVDHQNNVVFNNINFTGSNMKTFDLFYAQNIQILNCSVMYSGVDGIDASATDKLTLKATYFNYSNNIAVDLNYNCTNSSIRYNYIANTGMVAGMGLSGDGTYQAVTMVGNNNLAEYNTIYNTGATALRFTGGSSNVVKNNLINYFAMVKDDCGGIYTWASSGSSYTGQQITGNIVLNGIGAPEGTDKPGTGSSSGIYLDDNVANVNISANTSANCFKAGILLHNAFNITIKNNILFNNSTQLIMVHDIAMPNALLRNNIVTNNTFFAKTETQLTSTVSTLANDISLLGSMDNNYFCRPMDDNLSITSSCVISGVRTDRYHDLANWKSTYNLDKNSGKTPLIIPLYDVNSFSGSNKYPNGTFNSNISGLYTSPTSSWVNKLDGGTFQATNSFSTLDNYQVVINIGSISSSKNYILRFSAQASRDTLVTAYLQLNGSPYTRLSDIKIIPFTTQRTENEYLFTLPSNASSANIIFQTKCPKLNYWLDNVEFYDANVSVTDPDSYVFFQYNNSSSGKSFQLNGTYEDVAGNTYTNSIIIPAYSSVVLIKQTPANMLYTFEKSNHKDNLAFLRKAN